MLTTTIPTAQAQVGDVITHVDGHSVGVRTLTVIATLAPVSDDPFAPAGVKLASTTTVEHFLYPDTTRKITVQRDVAAPRKAVTRTVEGVKFTRVANTRTDDGFAWVSEDGRLEVGRHEVHNPCQEAHPVRITAKLAAEVRTALVHDHASEYATELVWAVQQRKAGYLCPGQEDHSTLAWGIWDLQADDWFGQDGPVDVTFTQAAGYAVRKLTSS
jgi:hypothetical protein